MNDPQGVTADTVETPTEDSPAIEANDAIKAPEAEEAKAEAPAEEVEVDYKSEAEKLQRDSEAKQAKIDKQRAALSAANKQREELQAQLATVQQAQAKAPEQPNIDDFDTHEDYVNALSDYKARSQFEKLKAEDLIKQQHDLTLKTNKEQADAFSKVEQEYRLENPDYDRAKTELQDHLKLAPVRDDVGNAIYDQAAREGGLAQVIDYFGSNGGENLPEFEKICSLSPIEAAVEIYKVQQTLKNVTPTKEKPLPKPLKSVKGTATATKALGKSSGSDILKWVNS